MPKANPKRFNKMSVAENHRGDPASQKKSHPPQSIIDVIQENLAVEVKWHDQARIHFLMRRKTKEYLVAFVTCIVYVMSTTYIAESSNQKKNKKYFVDQTYQKPG